MTNQKQMDQGPVVPPQAEKEARRSVTRSGQAAEDLRSAADATVDEYRALGKEV